MRESSFCCEAECREELVWISTRLMWWSFSLLVGLV